jgi:hypothetical protein
MPAPPSGSINARPMHHLNPFIQSVGGGEKRWRDGGKLLSRRAILVCETICGAPSRQRAWWYRLAVTNHASRVVLLCDALETIREYCVQPLSNCLPSAGRRTISLRVNRRPADQTAGTTGSPSTADSIARIPSCQNVPCTEPDVTRTRLPLGVYEFHLPSARSRV